MKAKLERSYFVIQLLITVIYAVLILWAMIAILMYQKELSKEKGETLMVVRLNIILPFVLFILLDYGSLFIQPLVYGISHHLPSSFNMRAILKQGAMLIELIAIIYYPMYAWGDIIANILNREIRGSQKVEDDLRRQTNALRNTVLMALVLGTVILLLVH